MLTRIATLFALGVFRVLGCLPLSALQSIGSGLGWFFWMIPGTYKRRAAANIALAYPDASPTMLREVLQQGLRMIMELPYLWAPKNAAKLNQLIRCDDWSLIDDALAQGNGLILISPHIGCFEMLGPFFSQRHPATVIFKEPRMKWLSNLIHQVRVTPQLTLVPASQRGVKGLVKTLLKGQTIGFLPDQVPTYGEGVLAPFLARTPTPSRWSSVCSRCGTALFLRSAWNDSTTAKAIVSMCNPCHKRFPAIHSPPQPR